MDLSTGESRNYTLKTHLAAHRAAHIKLAEAGIEPTEVEKVDYLTDSIKCPKLAVALATIKATNKGDTFAIAGQFLVSQLPRKNDTSVDVNVSSLADLTVSSNGTTMVTISDDVRVIGD